MGQLFGVESHTITYHLKEIYKTGELDEKATTRKIRAVQTEGKREFPILKHKGKVSALEAKLKAEQEFEKYQVKQDNN